MHLLISLCFGSGLLAFLLDNAPATQLALIPLWILFYVLRGQHDPTKDTDLLAFTFTSIWRNRLAWRRLLTFCSARLGSSPTAPLLIACVSFLGAYIILQNLFTGWQKSNTALAEDDTLLPRPIVHRCRTTHSRLFPEKHSFSYSYLCISIPVGCKGNYGSLVSVDCDLHRTWFHVRASDFLERDHTQPDLRSKLTSYLSSQASFI